MMQEIIARLGMDDSNFARGLNRAHASVKAWSASVTSAVSSIRGAFAALGVSFGAIGAMKVAREVSNFADELKRTAKELGVSTAELQSFNFAGRQLKVTGDDMAATLRGVAEHAAKNADVLKGYGIATTNADGSTRRFGDTLRDIGDRIQSAATEEDKMRVAMALLGREGMALLPVLRDGSAGLDRLAQSARDAGEAIEDGAIAKLQELKALVDGWKTKTITIIARIVTGAAANAEFNDEQDLFRERAAREMMEKFANDPRSFRPGMRMSDRGARALGEDFRANLDRAADVGRGVDVGFGPAGLAFTREQRAQMEERARVLMTEAHTQQALADRAKRTTEEQLALELRRTRLANEMTKVLEENEATLHMKSIPAQEKLLLLAQERARVLDVMDDESATDDERLAAARKLAQIQSETAEARRDIAEEEKRALEKANKLEGERVKTIRDQIEAMKKRLGFTVEEAASGERGGGGTIASMARRILRDESEARRLFDRAAQTAAKAFATETIDLGQNRGTRERYIYNERERARMLAEAKGYRDRAMTLDSSTQIRRQDLQELGWSGGVWSSRAAKEEAAKIQADAERDRLIDKLLADYTKDGGGWRVKGLSSA